MISERLSSPSISEALNLDSSQKRPVMFRRLGLLIAFVFAANLVSAAIFIARVNRPEYDDVYNIVDVHLYATRGVSVASVRSQTNAPGPLSFIWMATGVRSLGGEELRDARIASLASWVLLIAGVLLGARYSRFPQLWRGALLILLVFPHSVETTAMVLTEGPSLLFATLGALAWIESFARDDVTFASLALGTLGGFSMGLAVVCRQYYLALLSAAALYALAQYRARSSKGDPARWIGAIVSLIAAAVPVLALVAIWKGITCPGIATGASYSNWHARAGLNYFRPLIAAFYTAFYLLLLTFPVMFVLKPELRRKALLVACVGGITASWLNSLLLQPGPLRTAVHFVGRQPVERFVLFGLIAAVTIYNAIALASFIWNKRSAIRANPPLAFALLTIFFFVMEQFGVGGNLFLYERYMLQLAPFLGLVACSLLPRITYPRLLVLAAMFAVSHIMLWRYAFGA